MEHLVSKIRQQTRRTFALNDSHPGGILPITPTFDNWTRIEAIQQGFTAEVNCAATSDSDPHIHINQTTVSDKIFEIASCCNCTSVSTNSTGWQFPIWIFAFYWTTYQIIGLFFMVLEQGISLLLPALWATKTMSSVRCLSHCLVWWFYSPNVAVYLTSDQATSEMNKTCTIRPRWLNVNVTYVRGGLVTLEPTQNLPDIPLTSSALIKPAISSLDIHFAYSQTISGNHISDTLWEIVSDLDPEASLSKFNKLLEEKTVRAHYTRRFVINHIPSW